MSWSESASVKNGMTEMAAEVHVEIEGRFGESTNGLDLVNAGLSLAVNGAEKKHH